MDDEQMLTVDQAAELLSMSAAHVRRLVHERRIAFHKLGRSVRLSRADLVAYAAAGRVEPLDESKVWCDLRGLI
jgi:excisionase family DNA binding protein